MKKSDYWELYKRYPPHKYRCAFFPWLQARSLHHTRYGQQEVLWVNLLPLSKTAHRIIHCILGGSVWMKEAVTRQNKMAKQLPNPSLWKYPNPAQRAAHAWCRFPVPLKAIALLALLWGITKL